MILAYIILWVLSLLFFYFRQTKQFNENIINKVESLIMLAHTNTKRDYSFCVRMQCGIDLT